MYNFWLVQIRIHEAVNLLRALITDEFKGTFPNEDAWDTSLCDLIETMYKDDMVVSAGLLRYNIVPSMDDYGLVDRLDLIER